MFIDTRERPAGEVQQKVGRLRLSEAIRIGARLSPPGSKTSWRDQCGGTCAVMAACEGLFGKGWHDGDPADRLMRHFGISLNEWHGGKYQLSARYGNGESRESIADWLQSQGL